MTPEARIETWFRELLVQLDPRQLTRNAISFSATDSAFWTPGAKASAHPGDSQVAGRTVVVAIGKAAIAMAAGAQDLLEDRFDRGYVLTVDGPEPAALDDRWTIYRGGHPIPDQRGIDATEVLIETVGSLGPDDVVVALISGGGSALFEAPRVPLMLSDFAGLTRILLKAGAPIQHLNAVRTPLSQVKGGAFRRRSPAGRFVTLILSDVLGNDTQIIASGPTVEPAGSGAAALAVLDMYGLQQSVSPAVLGVLNQVAAEAPGWDYPEDLIEIVGDNHLAIALAGAVTREAGFATVVLDDLLEGEASELARKWVRWLLEADEEMSVVWGGGETTVTVRGNGRGGRNTEFALAAALELDRLGNDEWVVASLATDGQDGTTGSAGAVASRETISRARALGLDPWAYLAANDSGSFFERVGGLVVTGPSGTNVNDLYVGLRRSAR